MILYTTNETDTVLDPFAGRGTTLVACKALNRKSIGIEPNKEYCQIIIDRLNSNQEIVFRTKAKEQKDYYAEAADI